MLSNAVLAGLIPVIMAKPIELRSSNNTAANAGMVARNAAGMAMNNTNAMMHEKAARDVEKDDSWTVRPRSSSTTWPWTTGTMAPDVNMAKNKRAENTHIHSLVHSPTSVLAPVDTLFPRADIDAEKLPTVTHPTLTLPVLPTSALPDVSHLLARAEQGAEHAEGLPVTSLPVSLSASTWPTLLPRAENAEGKEDKDMDMENWATPILSIAPTLPLSTVLPTLLPRAENDAEEFPVSTLGHHSLHSVLSAAPGTLLPRQIAVPTALPQPGQISADIAGCTSDCEGRCQVADIGFAVGQCRDRCAAHCHQQHFTVGGGVLPRMENGAETHLPSATLAVPLPTSTLPVIDTVLPRQIVTPTPVPQVSADIAACTSDCEGRCQIADIGFAISQCHDRCADRCNQEHFAAGGGVVPRAEDNVEDLLPSSALSVLPSPPVATLLPRKENDAEDHLPSLTLPVSMHTSALPVVDTLLPRQIVTPTALPQVSADIAACKSDCEGRCQVADIAFAIGQCRDRCAAHCHQQDFTVGGGVLPRGEENAEDLPTHTLPVSLPTSTLPVIDTLLPRQVGLPTALPSAAPSAVPSASAATAKCSTACAHRCQTADIGFEVKQCHEQCANHCAVGAASANGVFGVFGGLFGKRQVFPPAPAPTQQQQPRPTLTDPCGCITACSSSVAASAPGSPSTSPPSLGLLGLFGGGADFFGLVGAVICIDACLATCPDVPHVAGTTVVSGPAQATVVPPAA